jgi:phosphate/phosphite/phosphonate ABC transporter binding protein
MSSRTALLRRPPYRRPLCAAVLTVLVALVAGCSDSPKGRRVDFAKRVDVAQVRLGTDAARSERLPLKVAIASVLSPTRTLDGYHDLLTYMGQQLSRPVRLFQRGTYAEINELLRTRDIDLAFVCAGALVDGERTFGMEAIVVPQVAGKTSYYSYLIVKRGNPIGNLADLRGKTFAFSDPLSNSGRIVPAYKLALWGETPESFFRRTVFTYSHDNSIAAVADGLVDAAAVDSLVYDYLGARDPDTIARTEVIARWGPYGIPPVAVHPDLELPEKRRLRQFLLSIHADPRGATILKELMIDRFVEVDRPLFESVRQMDAVIRRR